MADDHDADAVPPWVNQLDACLHTALALASGQQGQAAAVVSVVFRGAAKALAAAHKLQAQPQRLRSFLRRAQTASLCTAPAQVDGALMVAEQDRGFQPYVARFRQQMQRGDRVRLWLVEVVQQRECFKFAYLVP